MLAAVLSSCLSGAVRVPVVPCWLLQRVALRIWFVFVSGRTRRSLVVSASEFLVLTVAQ